MSQNGDASLAKPTSGNDATKNKKKKTENLSVDLNKESFGAASSSANVKLHNQGPRGVPVESKSKFQKSNKKPFNQGRKNPYKANTVKSDNDLNQESLRSIITVLQERLDPDLLKELSKARSQVVESYLENLDKTRKHHPLLQNKDKFEQLADSIRTVNSQKTALISVDLEAFEGNNNIITEIGLSIYDPFKEATSLLPSLVNIHIILKESLTLRNGKFVHDHKDNFLGGSSLVLPQKVAVDFVQTLFTFYFKERQQDGYEAAFVAHNGSGDLKWLTQLGVQIPNDYKMLDTEKIYTYSHGANGNSLGAILRRFHIPHSFLHNAGNDAYFTLIALLKLTDPQFRTTQKLDDHNEDIKYNERIKDLMIELKNQKLRPRRINNPRKELKSHEFLPYVEYFSYQDALLKAFEFY